MICNFIVLLEKNKLKIALKKDSAKLAWLVNITEIAALLKSCPWFLRVSILLGIFTVIHMAGEEEIAQSQSPPH